MECKKNKHYFHLVHIQCHNHMYSLSYRQSHFLRGKFHVGCPSSTPQFWVLQSDNSTETVCTSDIHFLGKILNICVFLAWWLGHSLHNVSALILSPFGRDKPKMFNILSNNCSFTMYSALEAKVTRLSDMTLKTMSRVIVGIRMLGNSHCYSLKHHA